MQQQKQCWYQSKFVIQIKKFKEMAAYIENKWGIPHCIGAIDGSHIPIIAPEEYHCDYFNHKGWHSIILQGVVDGKGLFWNVFTGLPGSLHDARVLRLSTLWELASRGNHIPANTRNIGGVTAGYYILGDSAYPLQNWLLLIQYICNIVWRYTYSIRLFLLKQNTNTNIKHSTNIKCKRCIHKS